MALLACQVHADDRPVDFNRLPAAAQAFVKNHYADVKVMYATKDDDIILPDYHVRLENGVQLQFANNGALEKIEAKAGVPDGVVPVQIVDYVKLTNFDNYERFVGVDLLSQFSSKKLFTI